LNITTNLSNIIINNIFIHIDYHDDDQVQYQYARYEYDYEYPYIIIMNIITL